MIKSFSLILVSILSLISFEGLSAVNTDSYSASFRVTEQFGFQRNTSPMIFTVLDRHVVRELPQQNVIEHWVKRSNGSHVFYRHFPDYQSSIHYTRGDLKAFNLDGDWGTVVQVVPDTWLDSLELVNETTSEYGPVQTFEGEIDGDKISIDWIASIGIPAKFSIRREHQRLIIELVELSSPEEALERLIDWDSYRKIDFSDAMDMERDEFVQYLLLSGKLETNGAGLHVH